MQSPILDFLENENRVPTETEFRHICLRHGISFQREAHQLIQILRNEGVFKPNMSPTLRQLAAVLARTAGYKPRLMVDNTAR